MVSGVGWSVVDNVSAGPVLDSIAPELGPVLVATARRMAEEYPAGVLFLASVWIDTRVALAGRS